MEQATLTRIAFWKTAEFDEKTRNEVTYLEEHDPQLLEDSFYKNLDFGTGGLRGEMGPGTNRMNQYTVSMATQGLADYLTEQCQGKIQVAIAFDSRNRSAEFARVAAEVLSSNGINVFLYDELRPTPLLSYTVRELKCQAGIVITASHNPKEYNGYKVYWADGGQLVPPHDKGIITKVRAINSPSKVKNKIAPELISSVPESIEEQYYTELKGLSRLESDCTAKKELNILYTALHGTGITMIPEALRRVGFSEVHVLESQATPDGDFPTVDSPNPEENSAMKLCLEEGERTGADIILGTDPDTDRVGMGIRNRDGQLELINGNQAAALLLYYLLEHISADEKSHGFVAKTVVTSDLLSKIAYAHKVPCFETLTGFKYIAELIARLEGKKKFIGGGEESYGYLVGDFVRDKDAVISSVMLCEMAAWARSEGKTVRTLLDHIYTKYGLYRETLVSLVKKGMKGAEEIQTIMEQFRTDTPEELGGIAVTEIADFSTSTRTDLQSGRSEAIALPTSNVIQFTLADGSKITARPSGTEPKIKYYVSVREEIVSDVDSAWIKAGEQIDAIKKSLGL